MSYYIEYKETKIKRKIPREEKIIITLLIAYCLCAIGIAICNYIIYTN